MEKQSYSIPKAAYALLGLLSGHEADKTFNIGEFDLPDSAEITEQHFDRKNTKTVIYLPDKHPDVFYSEDFQRRAKIVQETQKAVMNALLLERGQIDLVLEAADNRADQQIFIEVSNINKEQYRERVAATAEMISENPDTVIAHGSVSSEFMINTDRLKTAWVKAEDISLKPFEYPCLAGKNLNGVKVGDAMQMVFSGNADENMTACYCDAWKFTNDAYNNFTYDREVLAPKEEVKTALSINNDLVVLVSGYLHKPATLAALKEAEVNYVVIGPKGFDFDEVTARPLQDDSKGTCERWARGH